MQKRIPIGVSDFKEFIKKNYYYIDKTLLIKEIMEDGSKVILLPRPRRFGKTLNMTMLRYFFERTEEDNSGLFKGLKVWKHDGIQSLQGKFPVIYLTFKDLKHNSWDDCYGAFKILLSDEYGRHRVLLEGGEMTEDEKRDYEDILWRRTEKSGFEASLRKLSEYLYRHYGEKAVILIDEYDTPIYSSWTGGYYNDLISFIRNLLGGGLKDNPFIEKAVLTGIMRIAKESIFSGLNNLNVGTLLQEQYSDKFGFLVNEVEELMKYFGMGSDMPEMQSWYNGYVFGKKTIYNPWSVLNYVHKRADGFKSYWVNSGSSDIIRDMLTRAGSEVKLDMETLVKGGELVKAVREDTVLTDVEDSPETLWSFLLFSGYLKAVDTWLEDKRVMCRLKIPNKEVEYAFEDIIQHWVGRGIGGNGYRYMLKSLTEGDTKTFGKILRDIVRNSLSYFDVGGKEPEKFYHAFVLGIMISLADEYEVRSNRESGYGRYDVMLVPLKRQGRGIVIEFKKVDEEEGETLEDACKVAIGQIKEKDYRSELTSLGVKDVLELGIAFRGKEVQVMKG